MVLGISDIMQMDRTDQDFVDGLALDLFSPTNRTVVVQQNLQPLDGRFVTSSFGEPFMALSNYSYVVKVSDKAQDLIAKIELPYDPIAVAKMGVDFRNTYVGTLAADGKSWVISESQRNVHVYCITVHSCSPAPDFVAVRRIKHESSR